MPRIGVIAGVKTEAEALASVMHGADAPYLRLSGARPERARRSVEALLALGVDGILSFGTAGALSPSLAAGDLIVAERILSPNDESVVTDSSWTRSITDKLGIATVDVYGSEQLAGTGTKARLFADTGAVAVDMESHIAATLAARAGVPVAVLRAIVDPADFEFPGYVTDAVRPDGSVSLLPIIAGLCLQPWTFGRLTALNSYNRAAMLALGGAVRTLGPGFGLLAR